MLLLLTDNLGLSHWEGIEMDVAWGHTTLRFGIHRPSIPGPIFVYRASTRVGVVIPPRIRVMTHAASVPDQVLGEIASHYPDLQETWATDAWHLPAIDSTRGHSRNLMLMHPSYVLVHGSDY